MTETNLPGSLEIRRLEAGKTFKAIFVIKSLYQKTDKNGRTYYEISVVDNDGGIDAKVWSDASWFDRSAPDDDPTKPAPKLSAEKIKELTGSAVGVDGKVVDFRGQMQYNFNKITLLNQERFSPAKYLPRSPLAVEDMTSRFKTLIAGCRPEIADFLNFVFSGDIWREFRDWPAAVNHHHAYANGLLEHTLSVTDCAKSMAESFARAGYKIDIDIVVAGGLLHDIGKVKSYKMTTIPEITLEGAVIDHVALGYEMFMKLSGEHKLDDGVRLQLAHIILSHHGLREYGSPVVPATPEALVVSAADETDFRMFCWKDSIKDLKADEPISQWHVGTQRRFWNR